MKANTIKNIKNRKSFFNLEITQKIRKYILINSFFSKTNISSLNSNLFFVPKISKSTIKNKCVVTGRNKSINKNYSVSRIAFRNFLSYGFIPGYKKSVW
jgi:ribosomal protein S14